MELRKHGPQKVHRIVIVEDDLDSVHTLAALLREMGHWVDYAINGYVAPDVIRRFRPDTVICDIGLPGQTGLRVAEQVRKDPDLRGIRFVALTAYADDATRKKAKEAGFDAYYVKPMTLAQLAGLFRDKPA
jgi:CheY-like chemotaxis protein